VRAGLRLNGLSAIHPHQNDFVTSYPAKEAYNAAGRNWGRVRRALLGVRHAQLAQ